MHGNVWLPGKPLETEGVFYIHGDVIIPLKEAHRNLARINVHLSVRVIHGSNSSQSYMCNADSHLRTPNNGEILRRNAFAVDH